jgi:ABC-type uncharacterized transport system ATPase subunit
MPALLQFIGVSESFPGVKALDRISFEVEAGSVHAIVGRRGKNTLSSQWCRARAIRPTLNSGCCVGRTAKK